LPERVVMAGGGTGGHLFPAIAVARELEEMVPPAEVHFIGTSHGIEARILPREGYPLHLVEAEGFRGRGVRRAAALGKLAVGFRQSLRILRDLRPSWVLGVGGYASLPAGLAALVLRIPLFLHEQNATAGLANRILARRARRVFLSYSRTQGLPKGASTQVTGNPVRRELLGAGEEPAFFGLSPGRKVVLIFGGSQGARSINRAVVGDLGLMGDHRDKLAFIHQVGEGMVKEVEEAYARWGLEAHITPFIYEMGKAYATAHLVVCRAGATTLAELTALGKPSILIPFPHAVGNHQLHNARALEEAGAAAVITESEFQEGLLGGKILELLFDDEKREAMAMAAGELGRPRAAQEIARSCWEVVSAGR